MIATRLREIVTPMTVTAMTNNLKIFRILTYGRKTKEIAEIHMTSFVYDMP